MSHPPPDEKAETPGPCPAPLRVLQVEDSADDALLVRREVERGVGATVTERVETAEAFRAALDRPWDVILCDHRLPAFSSEVALRILRESGRDVPLVIVSGEMGEDAAVAAMKAGASDFVSKQNMARLGPAVRRELREAAVRRERALATQALRRMEQQLHVVLESTKDAIFVIDADGRVAAVYGAGLEERGGRREDHVGRFVGEILGGEASAAHAAACRKALAGEHSTYGWTLERPGRPVLHFHTSMSPIREGDRVVGAVAITRDITEMKRMEAQLVISDRMVSVGTLAAGVVHEINSPLACVIANLSMALEDLRPATADGGIDPEMLEGLADARTAAQQVRAIVQDLRIFSRGDDRPCDVDVEQVLESCRRMAWNEIKHRARLRMVLDALPFVKGSESRIGQVFLNLLVNAAQAMPEGRASENEIVVTARRAPGGITVAVADTGCGMPKNVLDRLFTPFFTTKPANLGTGLGLSICHRIVTSLGGRISVVSEVGRGSVFTVFLPAPEETRRGEGPPPAACANARSARILVIDDEALVRNAVRRVLAPRHEVVLETAPGALARIDAGERFDAVLCDLMMPVVSGMEVHAAIQARAPHLAGRIAFLTGGAFTPAARAFLETSGVRHLDKPFEPAALREFVNRVLVMAGPG